MKTVLFVGGISFQWEEGDLAAIFKPYGRVETEDAVIARSRMTRKSLGYGFISLENNDPKRIINEMHGRLYNGRPLSVTYAKKQSTPIKGGINR